MSEYTNVALIAHDKLWNLLDQSRLLDGTFY